MLKSSDNAIDIYSGGTLNVTGTKSFPVSFINYNPAVFDDQSPEYLWRDIHFHPGSTGYMNNVIIKKAGLGFYRNIGVENACLVISNAILRPGHSRGIEVWDNGCLDLYNVDIQYFNMYGVNVSDGSKVTAKKCTFANMNPTTGRGIQTDGSCDIDARECWWGDSSGPYPFGDGMKLTTNGKFIS